MRLTQILALLAFLSWSASAPPAQQPGAPRGQAQDPETRVLVEGDYLRIVTDEQRGVPLREFIKIASEYTRKTFHINWDENPTAREDTISLIGPMRVHRDEFFHFFQTMLYIKNYAVIPRGEGSSLFYELIFQAGPRRQEIRRAARWVPPEDIELYRHQTGSYIVTSIPLQFIDPTRAANTLRPYLGPDTAFDALTPIGNAKALLVAGFGPSVFATNQLLKLVDVKDELPRQEFRKIELEHAAAEEIEPILTELMAERTRTGARPADPQGITAALDPAEALPLKIIAHTSTNSLLVWAHRDRIIEIQNLVVELDWPIPERIEAYRVIPIRHVSAEELAEMINTFLQQVQEGEAQARAGAQPGQTGAPGQRGLRPVVVADKSSNSLLVTASPTRFDEIRQLIRDLDRRQPQVLIEAALIELSTEDLAAFGIELGLLDIGGEDFTRGFGFTSFGLTRFEDTTGSGFPDMRLPDFENPLRGVTGGIISSGDFAIPVIANALKSDRASNVLSIPSVLVDNNHEATVESQEEQPFTRADTGTVTTATTLGGFEGAGITLTITPSISSDNYLRMELALEVSRFLGAPPDPAIPPARARRKIETQVTMPTGHTMVMGGVIEDSSSRIEQGVPILKDIPILGWLFKSYTDTKNKTNLYFFLTPHILTEDDFSDLADITFRKKLEASDYIGHRRLRMVDPSWRGGEQLEDPATTLEHLDRMGGFDIPAYQRPDHSPQAPVEGLRGGSGNNPSPSRGGPRSPARNSR